MTEKFYGEGHKGENTVRGVGNMLAFAYTALIHLCDREPEKTEAAIAWVEAFSRHFAKVYGRSEQGG